MAHREPIPRGGCSADTEKQPTSLLPSWGAFQKVKRRGSIVPCGHSFIQDFVGARSVERALVYSLPVGLSSCFTFRNTSTRVFKASDCLTYCFFWTVCLSKRLTARPALDVHPFSGVALAGPQPTPLSSERLLRNEVSPGRPAGVAGPGLSPSQPCLSHFFLSSVPLLPFLCALLSRSHAHPCLGLHFSPLFLDTPPPGPLLGRTLPRL